MNGLLPYDAAEAALVTPPDLSPYPEVYLDTETTGLDWVRGDRPVGISVGFGGQDVYLPFAHRGGGNLDAGIVKRWAQRELRGKHLVGFNTRFELHMLRCWGVDLRAQGNTFSDVSHSGCLLDDHRSKNRLKLEDFAEDYLGATKINIGRPEHIADLPGNTVAPYACRDTYLTRGLRQAMLPKLHAEDLLRVQALEDACIPATVEMEANGLPINVEKAARWQRELARIADALIKELHAACGFGCTPSKKPDMARLFHRAGITYARTPTGQPEFPAEVVEAASLKSKEILLAYRWMKVQHLLSKVLTPFLAKHVHGTLYPSFNQMLGDDGMGGGAGTISGRYSSSNPNGQNLLNKAKYARAYGWLREYVSSDFCTQNPDFRGFLARDLVIPERGQWVNADQKQVEYRIAAHYANDARLYQAYRDNPDLDQHALVMEWIRPYRRDIVRDEAKAPGFARLYGGFESTVARNLRISVHEATVLVQQYDRGFPAYGVLFEKAMHAAASRGYVRTFLGRRCRFHRGAPGYEHRKALNHICQGTGADAAKQSLVVAYAERRALGLTLRVTEHDAQGGDLEGPIAPYKALLNEQRMDLKVPIMWDVKTGASWAEAK